MLGIISDTHDRLPSIDSALAFFKSHNVELVVHCGDWKSLETVRYFAEEAYKLSLPVKGVLGNNDIDVADFMAYAEIAPGDFEIKQNVFEFKTGGRTLAIYHGHHKPTLRRVVSDDSYDLVFLGHTHKPRIEEDTNKLIVNPGSTAFSIPRSKEWVASVAIVNSNTLTATIHYLR